MKNNITAINLFFLPFQNEQYWIFKIEDPRRNFLINNSIDVNYEYSIQYEVNTIQKRDFYGQVLFFFFNELLNEWTFEYQGNIKEYEYITEEESIQQPSKDKKKFFTITFNNIERLKEVKTIDELKYSIKNIKKLIKPLSGDKININKISRIEYDSIVLGEIYYSRTVFYKLFDSLQKDHKLAFYNEIFNLSKDKSKVENDCNKLLPLLQLYIENNIYKSAQLFVESIEILKSIDQNIDLSKIGFDDTENKLKAIDHLLLNYEYSKLFISSFENLPSQDEIRNEYSDFRKTETEFYKIFRFIPFPLDLL